MCTDGMMPTRQLLYVTRSAALEAKPTSSTIWWRQLTPDSALTFLLVRLANAWYSNSSFQPELLRLTTRDNQRRVSIYIYFTTYPNKLCNTMFFLFVNYCFGFELFLQVSFMSAGSELTWRNLWQAFVQLFLIAIWYPVHQAFLPISRAHRVPDAVAALLWCQRLKIAAHHLTNSTIDCCILISRIPSRGSPLSHDTYIYIRRERFLKAIDDVKSDQFSRAVDSVRSPVHIGY